MAAKPWLSILGLYRMNSELFSNMVLPDDVDRAILQNEIMEECAELEILFPDPAFMQESLGWWSASRLQAWEKMSDALSAEYNPIWNKDGTIKESRTYGQMDSEGEGSGYVSGFNSDALVNNSKSTSKSTLKQHTDTLERTEQGNIGVTESSAMVQHELDLREGPTIYNIIVEEFKQKYCLLVY